MSSSFSRVASAVLSRGPSGWFADNSAVESDGGRENDDGSPLPRLDDDDNANDEDEDGGDSGGDDDDDSGYSSAMLLSSVPPASVVDPSEAHSLGFIADVVRTLLVDGWKVSPFIADEATRVVRLIGTDADLTMLYDTLTSVRQWRLAITPYEKPFYEHAVFLVKYTIECPLDRMIYAVLVSQSLTAMYNTYKNWMTTEHLRSFTRYVRYLEGLRSCLKSTSSRLHGSGGGNNDDNEMSRIVLKQVVRYFADNTHVILHDAVSTILTKLDFDFLENMTHTYLQAINESIVRLFVVLRNARILCVNGGTMPKIVAAERVGGSESSTIRSSDGSDGVGDDITGSEETIASVDAAEVAAVKPPSRMTKRQQWSITPSRERRRTRLNTRRRNNMVDVVKEERDLK